MHILRPLKDVNNFRGEGGMIFFLKGITGIDYPDVISIFPKDVQGGGSARNGEPLKGSEGE